MKLPLQIADWPEDAKEALRERIAILLEESGKYDLGDLWSELQATRDAGMMVRREWKRRTEG